MCVIGVPRKAIVEATRPEEFKFATNSRIKTQDAAGEKDATGDFISSLRKSDHQVKFI